MKALFQSNPDPGKVLGVTVMVPPAATAADEP
jgi:hypothetical protein